MALDFAKVKALEGPEFAALALCEFSRFVDAIERIAPTDQELQPVAPAASVEPVPCPHPVELRQNTSVMGQEPFTTFICGLCHDTIRPQPVGA